MTGVVAVEHSDQADHNLTEGSLNISEDSNSRQEATVGNDNLEERIFFASPYPEGATYGDKHQLWQARISTPASEDDKEDKDELQKLILRVYSIEFKRTGRSLETMTVIESVSTAGPNETSTGPEAEAPEELEEKATALKPAYGTVSDQTLQMLRELLRHPDRLDNPFELAEVLFLSGHVKEAALAYKEALNRRSPNQPDLTNDRAWILLQIGNCLRYDNMPAAAQSYKKLITEYPDSPWCDLAKAQYKLIEWHLEDEPQTLTAEDVSLNSLTKNGATGSD
ncbi:MAG: tetratricopeptide repeat protein [Planctomycetota bacterium]